ncbi:MAG: murein transglycosylase, partial [Rhodospirillales bacterium]
ALGLFGQGIPKGLLTAISAVESGRWDKEKRATLAWPWTVTSGANGQFFASKAEAIAEVKRMKAQGIRNIDVGCLQINLHHHAEAFDSLEEAFDPATNAGYAARFLRSLFDTHRNWMTAASHYHSATPELGERYRLKVLAAWNGQELAAPAARTADWILVPPSQDAAPAPIVSARASATPPVRPAHKPVAPAVSDSGREEAKAFAVAWRQARLAEYKSRKAARGGV